MGLSLVFYAPIYADKIQLWGGTMLIKLLPFLFAITTLEHAQDAPMFNSSQDVEQPARWDADLALTQLDNLNLA